jgi:hypothetical protein
MYKQVVITVVNMVNENIIWQKIGLQHGGQYFCLTELHIYGLYIYFCQNTTTNSTVTLSSFLLVNVVLPVLLLHSLDVVSVGF